STPPSRVSPSVEHPRGLNNSGAIRERRSPPRRSAPRPLAAYPPPLLAAELDASGHYSMGCDLAPRKCLQTRRLLIALVRCQCAPTRMSARAAARKLAKYAFASAVALSENASLNWVFTRSTQRRTALSSTSNA